MANEAAEACNIKVVCRVRPLNATEEKAGSKFVLKFPTDDSISIGVSMSVVVVVSAMSAVWATESERNM